MTILNFTSSIFNLFDLSTRTKILAKPFLVFEIIAIKLEDVYDRIVLCIYILLFIFFWSQQTISLHLMNVLRLSVFFLLVLCNSSHTPAKLLVNFFMGMFIFFSFNINFYIKKNEFT